MSRPLKNCLACHFEEKSDEKYFFYIIMLSDFSPARVTFRLFAYCLIDNYSRVSVQLALITSYAELSQLSKSRLLLTNIHYHYKQIFIKILLLRQLNAALNTS